MSDPFTLFDLPLRFDLDEADLQSRFIRASAAAHPDRHIDPIAQAEAAELSAEINEAYVTLRDPEQRAHALLKLLAGDATADSKALPPDLLMEVMEVREEMEQAVASDDKAALVRLRQWAEDQRRGRLETVANLFTADVVDAAAILLQLNALRYAERMLEQMPD